MFRNALRVTGPYRVIFSAQAWHAVGQMPTATFAELQKVVDSLAEKSATLPAPERAEPGALRVTVGKMEVTYARDAVARTLTILDIDPPDAASR